MNEDKQEKNKLDFKSLIKFYINKGFRISPDPGHIRAFYIN